MTNREIEDLAYEIADLLSENGYEGDMAIYFNDKRLQCFTTNDEEGWKLEEGYKGSDFTEYANDDLITMTFEGVYSIYDDINGYRRSGIVEKFDKLLDEYDCYYELGNAWNLSVYEF